MIAEAKEKIYKIALKLTQAQRSIADGMKRFTFVRAGRKFGKTRLAEWRALELLSKPLSLHLHIAPTYRMSKMISWESFKRLIPAEALYRRPNDAELTMTLKNGSQLMLVGSDEMNSLRGLAPTSVTLEEAAFHKENAWADVIRPNLAPHRAPALFISTPNGYNWFKDLEDECKDRISDGDPEWAFFQYTIYDNPYIDRSEIEKIKKTCDPRTFSQEYLAEYESSVGRVFHEFQDTERHVRPFPLPVKGEACYRAIDWGLRDDTAVLWAFIRMNKLHIYRENSENSIPASQQARMILNRTPPTEDVVMNIIGHDAARQDPNMKGLTVQWHFSNAGITPLRLSSRNKDASRTFIAQLLSEDRIVIHPECRKLRKEMLAYSWKQTARSPGISAMETTEHDHFDLIDGAAHYLTEMLQYKLFLNRPDDKPVSLDEIYRKIRAGEAEQKKPKYPLVRREQGGVLEVAGTPAGYV